MIRLDRKSMLAYMARGGWLAAFNVYDLVSAQAALDAACEVESPVLLAVGERYLEQVSLRVMRDMIAALAAGHPFPVGLHLDHAKHEETIRQALELGFTSVMFDGSSLPLEKNIELSRSFVKLAHSHGAAMEGEVGALNDEDGSGETAAFTQPEDAARFWQETGADLVAVAVGNRHGAYRGDPHVSLERLHAIAGQTGCPLVLHGCSGIPANTLHKAIQLGVRKLNINTEMAQAGATAAKSSAVDRYDSILPLVRQAMKQTALIYLTLEERENTPL